MDVNEELLMIGRLSLAAFLGGLVGLERERHSQPAGLRTHMIVCLGSCLMMLVSIRVAMFDGFPRTDPGRIAAQVVTGIGFLGAGAIMRYGMSIKGLTTAASLWTVAGIGLAAGCGYWTAALVCTLFTITALWIFDKFEKAFLKERTYRKFVVQAKDGPGLVGRLEQFMEKAGIGIKEVDLQRDFVEKRLQVTLLVKCPDHVNMDELSRGLSSLAEVEKVEIE